VLGALVRHLGAAQRAPIAIPRISAAEAEFELLESWGFRRVETYVGVAVAEPRA
jgi:hypothetical protein